MIKISIYKVSDYKKSGDLKKKAIPLFEASGENHSRVIEKVARDIKTLSNFEKPYFFTHIKATDLDQNEVRITEQVQISEDKDEWLMTSPEQLFKELTK